VQICRGRGIPHPSRQNMKTVVRHHLSPCRWKQFTKWLIHFLCYLLNKFHLVLASVTHL
jgi:hypothetical protein